ncbi:MAG: chondroitinase-B domain-containing protein [Bacteroidota bacterium]
MMKNSAIISILLLLSVAVCNSTYAGRKVYSSASTFKSAATSAVPGDTLELANGTYDISTLSLTKSGTENARIVIKSQNKGLAVLNGKSAFACKGIAFVTIEGFLFTSDVSTVIKTESCNNIRITRNSFRLSETTSSKWILIGGTYNIATANSHHNRVDHNLFENKKQLGNYVTIDGSPSSLGTPEASQYDLIDHNHFRTIGPRAVNEMETIRIGQSEICRSNSYTTVEFNLFEECDGDPEIISVKTRKSYIRNNTFVRSQGTVCLRSSDSSIVEGNFFFGGGKSGTGGIRMYGSGHSVMNNYFSGLTGDTWDAALTITNGDAELSGSNTSHWRPTNILVAFNTYVDNANNIQFGFTNNGSYSKAPQNITFANNLVVGSSGQLVKVYTSPTGMTYSGNIMFPKNGATVGISASAQQINVTDPNLVLTDSLWRVTAGSAVIDAAAGTFDQVTSDIDGQMRDALKDVGADEFKQTQRLNRPLTAADVGPNGPDSIVTHVAVRPDVQETPESYALGQNYPNPFNPSTIIVYTVGEHLPNIKDLASVSVHIGVYDILGNEIAELVNKEQRPGTYSVRFNGAGLASGIYYYCLQAGTFAEVKKMILMK